MQIVHLDERREFSKPKIRALNELMLLFSVAPAHYRKILFVLKHLRGNVSLAAHYIKDAGPPNRRGCGDLGV